jgi:DNA-binding IclR family transcriptional regulator
VTEETLTDRQVKLLRVVAEGAGKWDARWIDVTMTTRYGPSDGTVMRELKALEALGLVAMDPSTGVGGRWSVTPEASSYCG